MNNYLSPEDVDVLFSNRKQEENMLEDGRCFCELARYAFDNYPVDYDPKNDKLCDKKINDWIQGYVIEPIMMKIISSPYECIDWVVDYSKTLKKKKEDINKHNTEMLKILNTIIGVKKYDIYAKDMEKEVSCNLYYDIAKIREYLCISEKNALSVEDFLFVDTILRISFCFQNEFEIDIDDPSITLYTEKIRTLTFEEIKTILSCGFICDDRISVDEMLSIQRLLKKTFLHTNLLSLLDTCYRRTCHLIITDKKYIDLLLKYQNYIKSLNVMKAHAYAYCNPFVGPAQILADIFGVKITILGGEETIFFIPKQILTIKEIFIRHVEKHFLLYRPDGVLPRCVSQQFPSTNDGIDMTLKINCVNEICEI
jgi:hypothetical protein